MLATSRPAADEYAPALADYVAELRDDKDVVEVLATQLEEVPALVGSAPGSSGDYRYAPGKWTLKEVVGDLRAGRARAGGPRGPRPAEGAGGRAIRLPLPHGLRLCGTRRGRRGDGLAGARL